MSGVVEWYRDLIDNKQDPRTVGWFLVDSPGPILTIVITYVYFCVSAGPRYMKDKKPYDLKNTLIVYNFIQILLSVYLFHEGLMSGWLYEYDYICEPVDYSFKSTSMRMARAVHTYYICKVIELLDTVFFVMRKKDRQITALHLYHHSMMPICAWIGVKFFASGHPTLLGVINAFIHIFMYTYYMLTAFGPHMHKYVWWKKYLTIMQIVQFIIVFCHNLQMLFTSCNFPKPLSFLLVLNAGIFTYMFGSFYVDNYLKSDAQHKSKTKKDVVSITSDGSNQISDNNTLVNENIINKCD
ncbi:elongation of very long chain fatty acids protein AAEL008004-like [Pseudomyrmex gracilis]|uniref:elongation of very long chain fatty acids protein AAEL008004-like n=1 Tax=Pseudomyrmex gracilis TaxID=219809 RepID=UPI000995D207|nr:elongation of very long chain fatty acids protein AAEL008004-like [Pseudomyrmex gracilis]XP_020287664.1 elongation of very long chain fatty acids protein AAEL008004-like [Pseudomyrmex gracilis]